MSHMHVNIKQLRTDARLPVYGSPQAAGADLFACLPDTIAIYPGISAPVPTGLAVELPEGYVGLIYARSGLACKQGLAPANKVGVIDSDYRGEMIVMLHNHSRHVKHVHPGDRIAQFVITPVIQAQFHSVDELTTSTRGSGGFGSTGV